MTEPFDDGSRTNAALDPLQKREGILRQFVERAPSAMAMFDGQMRYLAASERWSRDFGIELIDVYGRSHYDLFPEIPPHWKEAHRRCLSGVAERREEEAFVRADGRTQWLRWDVQPWHDDDGRIGGIIIHSEDLTRRKEAEAALEEARRRQRDESETTRLLLETAAQGIIAVDTDGNVVMANAAIERLFGYQVAELLGQPIERLLPESLRYHHERHRTEYFASPRPRPMGLGLDLIAQRKDGTTFPVEVSLNHVATNGGRAIAFVTDITQRKRAETALRDRTTELERRTLRLSQIAAELTVAEQHAREELSKALHDGLQQLLFSTRLKLDRLGKRLADADVGQADLVTRARQDLDEAIAAARSLSVELFPPALHREGLPAGLAWLAGLMQKRYGLAVDVTADPTANPERRDVRILIFESVRELLFNVVKHAGVGRVTVDVVRTADGGVEVTVADRGAGFDPSQVFGAGAHAAAGLGLFSVRERLMLLGGRLDIDSAPGRGSRFTLVAPASGPERRTVSRTDGPSTDESGTADGRRDEGLRPLTILIADDHAIVREGLRELFADHPELQVVGEASNGQDAVALAHAVRPDVVVMDVSMPQMDGIEATRRIVAELPSVRVFGLSTQELVEGLHAIQKAGAAGYFTKGTDIERLVAQLLSLHRSDGGPSTAESPGPNS